MSYPLTSVYISFLWNLLNEKGKNWRDAQQIQSAASGNKYPSISRAIRFATLFAARSAPLVVCKVKRLYIGIAKDIIDARRRSAPLVVCKHP